jgi:hypothetical protein
MAENKTENKGNQEQTNEDKIVYLVPLDIALGQIELCKQALLNNVVGIKQTENNKEE